MQTYTGSFTDYDALDEAQGRDRLHLHTNEFKHGNLRSSGRSNPAARTLESIVEKAIGSATNGRHLTGTEVLNASVITPAKGASMALFEHIYALFVKEQVVSQPRHAYA